MTLARSFTDEAVTDGSRTVGTPFPDAASFTLPHAYELLERVVDNLSGIEALILPVGDHQCAAAALRLNLAAIKDVLRAMNVIQALEEDQGVSGGAA